MSTTKSPASTPGTRQFVWFEYLSPDVRKAQGFFGELFHWSQREVPMPDGTYTMIAIGEHTIGGYWPAEKGGPQGSSWLPYLGVANLDEALERARKAGGQVHKPAFDVGDFARMAVLVDPTGGAFALWQPKRPEEPPAPVDNSFCWVELYSPDPDAALAFYRAVGELDTLPMNIPGSETYHVLASGGVPRGGITKAAPGQATGWVPVVQVASADATANRAKQLGAKVTDGPTDVPEIGRFANVIDPLGAMIGILQPPGK